MKPEDEDPLMIGGEDELEILPRGTIAHCQGKESGFP